MSITLTDRAVSKIKDLYSQDQTLNAKALRISVEAGGCSGYSYAFNFDAAKEADMHQKYKGFELIVDKESLKFLEGATVDYKEDFGSEGFAIQNPNAKKSCGCGTSFST